MSDAYLDIETAFDGSITVIGIYRPDHGTFQLVDGGIHDVNIYRALDGVETIYTYNGGSFDLPYIKRRVQVDLKAEFRHHDLMRSCWKQGLKGGLKKVELQLGIVRETAGISGWDAPKLWHRYQTAYDTAALDLLLRYNREDVIYLPILRAYLERTAEQEIHEHIEVWWE